MRWPIFLSLPVAAGIGCGGDDRLDTDGHAKLALAPEQGVYIGVSCAKPNVVTCDRVRIYIRLRRPAEHLTARIHGRPIELGPVAVHEHGSARAWEGALRPAGLRDPDGPLWAAPEPGRPRDYWSGIEPMTAKVELSARYPDGTVATRTMRAPVMPGWG